MENGPNEQTFLFSMLQISNGRPNYFEFTLATPHFTDGIRIPRRAYRRPRLLRPPPQAAARLPAVPSGEAVYPETTTYLPPPAGAAAPLADPYPLETTVPPSLGRGSALSIGGHPAESTVPQTPAPKPPRPPSAATVSRTPPRAPAPPPSIRLEDWPAQSSKPPPPPPRLSKPKASFPRILRHQDKEARAATKNMGPTIPVINLRRRHGRTLPRNSPNNRMTCLS